MIAHQSNAHAQMEAVAEATPLIASSCSGSNNGNILALLERCYRNTDRYDKEAQWLAPAPNLHSRPLKTRGALKFVPII